MTSLRMWKESPTERSAGAKEKQELLFFGFVHGGSTSPPILFLSRGAAYLPPLTYQVWYWLELMWPCFERGHTENVQFSRYATGELRFSGLSVPSKREVICPTTQGPCTVCAYSRSYKRSFCLAFSPPPLLWDR